MSKLLVILSPSTQPANRCVICGSEETHCRHLALAMHDYLSYYSDVVHVHVLPPQPHNLPEKDKLQAIVRESNEIIDEVGKNYQKTLHIPLHTNAYNTENRGVAAFHYPTNERTRYLGKEIVKALPSALHSHVLRNDTFYEILHTKADALYLETYYHDNIDDATFFHNHIREVASIISTQLLKYAHTPI